MNDFAKKLSDKLVSQDCPQALVRAIVSLVLEINDKTVILNALKQGYDCEV